jgi:hypothetical protein
VIVCEASRCWNRAARRRDHRRSGVSVVKSSVTSPSNTRARIIEVDSPVWANGWKSYPTARRAGLAVGRVTS